ncbi:MAG: hypothetical protein FJ125_03930 [Deltaproteobacteria bacterium]|nr:hypothetical protein [Deltaproteobacteria bacterium]
MGVAQGSSTGGLLAIAGCAFALALLAASRPAVSRPAASRPAASRPAASRPAAPSSAPALPDDAPLVALARGVLATIVATADGPDAPPGSMLLRVARALLLSDGIRSELGELPAPLAGVFLRARLPGPVAGEGAPPLVFVLPVPDAVPRPADPPVAAAPVERAGRLTGSLPAGGRGLAAVLITSWKLLRREQRTPARPLVLLLVPGGSEQAGAVLEHLAVEQGALIVQAATAGTPAATALPGAAAAPAPAAGGEPGSSPLPSRTPAAVALLLAAAAEASRVALGGEDAAPLVLGCRDGEPPEDPGGARCTLAPLPWGAEQRQGSTAVDVPVAALSGAVRWLRTFLQHPALAAPAAGPITP